MDTKSHEKYRQLIRTILALLLIMTEGFIFYYVWTHFFNPYVRNPYRFIGNYFLLAVYMILTMVFANLYGGLKLGYYRLFDIILSQTVCIFATNLTAYFVIVIPVATWYLSPLPLIYMTFADLIIIVIWSILGNRFFNWLFPAQKIVVIYTMDTDLLSAKFGGRPDRYQVVRRVKLHLEDTTSLLGQIEQAIEISAMYDGVIIGDIKADIRNDLLKRCYSQGIRTYTLPKVSDVILKSSEILHIFDSPVFLNRNYGLTIGQEFAKRIFDIILSLFGIVICSPILVLTALAIKLNDGGPIFYRQKRCTRNGKVFEIIKFRSMIVNAEIEGVSVPATEQDPRITKIGTFIRLTRIDELPQLFNILKGEMSIVGPRPERIEHVQKYTKEIPEFRYRMLVKGGLTGYAQIYGKYNTTPYDKLKLDLLYIQNYSMLMDISIVLKTIKILFTKESTEGFDKETSKKMGDKDAE